jgi:NAD-dependent SIR2 family protein deacetylase
MTPDVRRIMPECINCGSFVTDDYVRVFAPDGMENPRVCPNCEDMVRDGANVRKARAKRT